uniref:Glycosyl transferase family 1 n=1 Tax=Thermosporothrix sp. COM3 TaxID=2490863 RepID=A0A455SLM1_9CHLR|nr:hypothetical protein KTC_33670 [Thermosporothrix sp. COM3]
MPEQPTPGKRLRICVFSFMFHPFVGGSEAQAEKHAQQLRALGHDVTVMTLRHYKHWDKRSIHNGLPILRIGGLYYPDGRLRIGRTGHLPYELMTFIKLWRMRHHFDVIHMMQVGTLGAIAAFITRFTGTPLLISVQSAGPTQEQLTRIRQQGAMLMADTLEGKLPPELLRVPAGDWTAGDLDDMKRSIYWGGLFQRYLKRSHARYQVLSHRSAAYLIANGIAQEKIFRIPNGIDTEQVRPIERRPTPEQRERIITCVARMEYPKGVDVLLHAWARMMREWHSDIQPRLRLVGEGAFRPQIERIASELGILDSVEFLGLRRDVMDLLHQSWGFVLPSRWEGMPNALLEAMACGLPCVATRVSGSEDLIVDQENGLLVPPEDPVAMAQALRHLIEDHEHAERMGQAARTTVERDYNLKAIVHRTIELYYSLLTEKK